MGLAALGLDVLELGLTRAGGGKVEWDLLPRGGRALAWALGATAVQLAATYLLYRPVLAAWPALAEQTRGLFQLLGQPTGAQAALLLPFIVLSEELVFRGALQGLLGPRLGPWPAAGVAVAVYGRRDGVQRAVPVALTATSSARP